MRVKAVCCFCEEELQEGEMVNEVGEGLAHRDCLLRSAIGSVGHQKGQCSCYGVEDTSEVGLTRREAASAACRYYESRREEYPH